MLGLFSWLFGGKRKEARRANAELAAAYAASLAGSAQRMRSNNSYEEAVCEILSHLRDQGEGQPSGAQLFCVLTVSQNRLDRERLQAMLYPAASQYGLEIKDATNGEVAAVKS